MEIHNLSGRYQPVFRMVLMEEVLPAMLLEGVMPREDTTDKTIVIKVLQSEQVIEARFAHRMHL